jgi:hypothetical protein
MKLVAERCSCLEIIGTAITGICTDGGAITLLLPLRLYGITMVGGAEPVAC